MKRIGLLGTFVWDTIWTLEDQAAGRAFETWGGMKILAVCLLCCMLPLRAAAQEHPSRAGVPSNCHGVFTSTLSSGRVHKDFQACAPALGPEVARVVRDSRGVTDARRLGEIITYAQLFRAPEVSSAALLLASDRSATKQARALALLVAYAQIEPGLFPSDYDTGYEALITGPVSAGCALISATDGNYMLNQPLAEDSERQLFKVLADILADSASPASVRALAACGMRTMRARFAGPEGAN